MSSMGFDPGPDGYAHLFGDDDYEMTVDDSVSARPFDMDAWIQDRRTTSREDFKEEDDG